MPPAAAYRAGHRDRDATSHREALRAFLHSASARPEAHPRRPQAPADDTWARGSSRSEYGALPAGQGRRRSASRDAERGSWEAEHGSWDAPRERRYVGGGSGRRGFAGHEENERHGGKSGNHHESIDDSLSDRHAVDDAAEHGRAASAGRVARGRRGRGVGLEPLSHLSVADLHMQAKQVRRDLAPHSNERDDERLTDFTAHETRDLRRGAEGQRILWAEMQNREEYRCREGEALADGLQK